ncbi:MAG TPA: hypothetical protein VM778_02225 [Gemmatimonadota bacterium]|nr:hypothetical protein [Gemmatimonadota bacterium]
MTRLRPAPLALVLLLAVACAEPGEAPDYAREIDTDGEAAPVEGLDPRLVLFDVQTRLESARAGTGEYPAVGEFRLADQWDATRALLDAGFDEWRYVREGEDYRLSGAVGGKSFTITSPAE